MKGQGRCADSPDLGAGSRQGPEASLHSQKKKKRERERERERERGLDGSF